jgi:hypothetical protein
MDKISHTRIKQPSFGEKRPVSNNLLLSKMMVGFMVFNSAFNNISVYRGGQFY